MRARDGLERPQRRVLCRQLKAPKELTIPPPPVFAAEEGAPVVEFPKVRSATPDTPMLAR